MVKILHFSKSLLIWKHKAQFNTWTSKFLGFFFFWLFVCFVISSSFFGVGGGPCSYLVHIRQNNLQTASQTTVMTLYWNKLVIHIYRTSRIITEQQFKMTKSHCFHFQEVIFHFRFTDGASWLRGCLEMLPILWSSAFHQSCQEVNYD